VEKQEKAQSGFKNAAKIFERVYEPSHSFLTDFVSIYAI
jgi:hypothetical protein